MKQILLSQILPLGYSVCSHQYLPFQEQVFGASGEKKKAQRGKLGCAALHGVGDSPS